MPDKLPVYIIDDINRRKDRQKDNRPRLYIDDEMPLDKPKTDYGERREGTEQIVIEMKEEEK